MCETREALTEKLYRLQRAMRGRTVLVQEMLTIEEEYSISGVCLGETVVLPALLKELCIAEHEKGVTLARTGLSVRRARAGARPADWRCCRRSATTG